MAMKRGTWWGVGRYKGRRPRTTTRWLQYLWKGRYPYGAGDSRHHGLDVGATTGMPIYAWARCVILVNAYDRGGYHRYVQVWFPSVNASLTLGHLRNGSTYPVGTWFQRGDYIGRVGTKREGLTHPHVHYRYAPGKYYRAISPYEDRNPYILWRQLFG